MVGLFINIDSRVRVSRVTGSRKVEDFMRRNRARLLALEDAYLMARYFTREYGREDAEDSIALVKEVLKLLRKVLGEEA